MENKIAMTVFNQNFGTMDQDDGSKMEWANCQTLTDFQVNGNKCGCQIGKVAVVTDNHFAVSKQLKAELEAAQAPIEIIGSVGMGVVQGKSTFVLKSFEIAKAKHG
ncbi:hypothetical protein [Vibrio mediterranei]|uniref:hypothetical protein n=1 Tax=Vibrio mediterranei TaxID=689 RepID=UPI00148CDF30|nr:hypothetical protein [Vibrio mediterranei]NOH31660.1 hypothetical protein [Vibrio mediterranei]